MGPFTPIRENQRSPDRDIAARGDTNTKRMRGNGLRPTLRFGLTIEPPSAAPSRLVNSFF